MIISAVSSSPARRCVRATTGAAPAIRLHARCLVVLLAAIACLAPTAPVRAQHPAPPGASAQGAAQTRAADDASIRPFHIHVRSRHPNALPLIMTHGWPGSIFELLKTVWPLPDPTAHGGRALDAFDLVIPSIPGFGFSGKPSGTGWDPDRITRVWAELMQRLGYTRYVAQGGDWGAPISSAMARQAPAGLLGIHLNLPATVPPEVAAVLAGGEPAPAGLSEKVGAAFDALDTFYKKNRAYAVMMATRPQTIGYALTDSPAGLAAWMYDYNGGEPERLLTKDEMLDDIILYWLTHTAISSARLSWENNNKSNVSARGQQTADISIPVGVTVVPGEIYRAPQRWTQRAYRHLMYFNEVDKGGHFAAWEQPQLFAEEIRAAFRSLRSSWPAALMRDGL